MAGNNPTLYGYVFDPNIQINPFGLKKYVVYQAYELDAKGTCTEKIYTGRTNGNDNMSIDQILNRQVMRQTRLQEFLLRKPTRKDMKPLLLTLKIIKQGNLIVI